MPAYLIGIASALASAVVWGTGDFAGGLAARRNSPLHVLMLASLTGLVVLLPAALLRGEPAPDTGSLLWSLAAGIAGGLGIAVFYRALSTGPAALVAPTAGVVGASVPVVVAFLLSGLPGAGQLLGLLLGLAGIGLVSYGSSAPLAGVSRPLPLALAAGLGFGGFFVAIAQVRPDLLFGPLVVAKSAAWGLGLLLLAVRRRPMLPGRVTPLVIVAGLFDAGGNLFFLLASQYVNLGIAAVISSMYPGTTVLLARVIQHERISVVQTIGIAACLCAVALIAAST